MIAEILSVGTELLLGQIVDTNASYLGRTLAGLGVDLYYKSTVGDNEGRVLDTLRRARERADLILTSGGLGPTEDDLTKECIGQVFEEELVLHEPSLAELEAFFSRRGIPMPPRNRKQALIYRNGRPIPNPNGTAPGALLHKGGKIVISLPGPPNELIPMVENHVVPYLTEQLSGRREYLVTRVLRFIGIGESALEEKVQDLIRGANPTLAPLAHTGEVHLRMGAKAGSPAAAEALLVPLETELRRRVGRFLYGTDRVTLEEAVVRDLAARNRTIALAEGCTGGLLGGRLTQSAAGEAVFRGALAAPTAAALGALLELPAALLEPAQGITGPAAEAMAAAVRVRLGADLGVAVVGQAGEVGATPAAPSGLA
ncbi:MAG: competence/damage-inducible protein A, partial [Armatimonadetes bacterium]|nr:competence/damage-inducible protein A [Armatimonadota bacterium]